MNEEKSLTITYQGNQISIFSDDRDDYINITEMAKAWRARKSIRSWMRNQSTLGFLTAWERKHNPKFVGAQMDTEQIIDDRDDVSIKNWIDKTNAIGIFTRAGNHAGTYAHKDIAIKFAAWLSPEFELWIVEKIQELRQLEDKKNSFELLTYEEVLSLIKLKEIFKYVAHQNAVETAHKEVYAAMSSSKNPFADFNTWRNEILDISVQVIDDRIKQYCIDHKIALTRAIMKKTKGEKILQLDQYESVRNAVWDFLNIGNQVNALNLANLVADMIRIEKGEVRTENKADLFHEKQIFEDFEDFDKFLNMIPRVQTAREVLEYRKYSQGKLSPQEAEKLIGTANFKRLSAAINKNKPPELSAFNKSIQTALNYNPKDKE